MIKIPNWKKIRDSLFTTFKSFPRSIVTGKRNCNPVRSPPGFEDFNRAKKPKKRSAGFPATLYAPDQDVRPGIFPD